MKESPRSRLTQILLERVASDRYPSVSFMNRVESVIGDRDSAEEYAGILLDGIERDSYPSPTMLDRVQRIVDALEPMG